MDISKFTVEDLVYDPSFRKWVLQPDSASENLWHDLLQKNPQHWAKVAKARELLQRIESGSDELSESEYDQVWENIDMVIESLQADQRESKIIPLNSQVNIERQDRTASTDRTVFRFYRIAAILVVVFWFGDSSDHLS